VKVDLSNEEINDLIDENLEDVMNNTTVVVFQEYHNNTTVVNHYSNNTTNNMDQTGTSTTTYNYNGSNTQTQIQLVRLDWDFTEYTEEHLKRDQNFTVNHYYFDYATNDWRTDEFTLQCSNYYDAPTRDTNSNLTHVPYWSSNSDAQDDYVQWWDYQFNTTIRDLIMNVAYDSITQDICKEADPGDYIIDPAVYGNYNDRDYSTAPVFFEMSVPNGTMLRIIQIRAIQQYPSSSGGEEYEHFSWTVNEQWLHGYNPSLSQSDYCPIVGWHYDYVECVWFGGWQDFDLRFNLVSGVYQGSVFSFTMYYELQPVSIHS